MAAEPTCFVEAYTLFGRGETEIPTVRIIRFHEALIGKGPEPILPPIRGESHFLAEDEPVDTEGLTKLIEEQGKRLEGLLTEQGKRFDVADKRMEGLERDIKGIEKDIHSMDKNLLAIKLIVALVFLLAVAAVAKQYFPDAVAAILK